LRQKILDFFRKQSAADRSYEGSMASLNVDDPYMWHNRKTISQAAQKGQTSHPPNPGNYFTCPP